ncbi:MAG: ferrous iron transport protein B [Dehalococcoidia bacterium]|nr:ferrous iron transport protein B [Dehalococcoidia bacterium]
MANLTSCHPATPKKGRKHGNGQGKPITIALAGNANVGKSVIFNQLTGSHQTIGNWPGKTVESAEGFLHHKGYDITIVDLPGIYSLSTFSLEELVTREYIAYEKPDVIINVIGAPVLERNLFFTLQLMEMGLPMVVCLNQMDIATEKGIAIDAKKLETMLGTPVVPTVAARGQGIPELIEKAVQTAQRKQGLITVPLVFRDGIETQVGDLARLIETERLELEYPARFVAVKLLEGDTKIKELVGEKSENALRTADDMAAQLENTYQQPRFAIVASERYVLASQIARDVQSQAAVKITLADRLDRLTTQKVFGYIMSFAVIVGLLLWTFTVGNYLSTLLSNVFSFFQNVNPVINGPVWSIIWNGIFGGFVAGVTLVIPYVIPFYLMLAIMEDSGILTRVAFMMDSAMHQMGLHGKSIIPLILGYGCNVPAIYTTRIMGTRRERLLASFAITFAPCAARTIVILGLVAAFVGTGWALALYAIDLLIMFTAVKVALRVIPGDTPGLIMEIHSFKTPSLSVVARQTWSRTRSLVYMVMPLYIIGTALVQGLYAFGVLEPVNNALSFLTVGWLGLPVIAGILLIFGVVRKELILLTLVAIYGTNVALVLTSAQFIILALVGILYLPCIATIGILAKEFGWKASAVISAANLFTALLVGGIAARVITLVM